MKKIAVVGLFLASFNLFAAKVPAEKLERVNAFISLSLGQFSNFGNVRIAEAHEDEESGDLNSVTIAVQVKRFADFEIFLKLEGQKVFLNASIEGKASNLEFFSLDDAKNLLEEVDEYVQNINDKGLYKAESITTKEGTEFVFKIRPHSEEAESIESVDVTITFPTTKDGNVSAKLEGVFLANSENVEKATRGLTNIFQSLANEETPNEEDFELLGEVFKSVFESLEEAEEVDHGPEFTQDDELDEE